MVRTSHVAALTLSAVLLILVAVGLAGCAAAATKASSSIALTDIPTATSAPAASLSTSPGSWTTLQITHNWTKNERCQLDGRRLVWQAYDGVDWEIESYDLATGAITQLTEDSADQTDPQLSGDHVLWIGHIAPQPPGSYSLWVDTPTLSLYDLNTDTSTVLPGSEGVQYASLAGGLVTWRSGNGTAADIYLYDLASGQGKRLTNDDYRQGHPQTDGHVVAFATDPGDGHTQVFAYDASTGSMYRLSSSDPSFTASDPQVNAQRVAWLETDGKEWSVLLWDAATEETRMLSRSEKRETGLGLGGDTVAWLRWDRADPHRMPHDSPWAVILYDLATGSEREVADGAFGNLWLEPDGKLLVYTQFAFGGGPELRALDPVSGQDELLDPDPERLSVGGPSGQEIGGRGVALWSNWETGTPDYVVGPSLNGGRIAFGTYQSVNGVYDDSDITLAYRGSGPPVPAAPSPPTRRFADIASSPYRAAIEQLAAQGIVRGKAAGGELLFSPSEPTLRWQFLRMVLEVTGVRYPFYTEQPKFSDLIGPSGEDFFLRTVVEAGVELGITNGTGSSRFAPYAPISRAQAVTMLVRAANATYPGALDWPLGPAAALAPPPFAGSLGEFSAHHAENMRVAEYNGLLEHIVWFGPAWDPWAPINRGEAAQILVNLEGKL